MVITIPEDFSRSAATLLDDEPQKMELKYANESGHQLHRLQDERDCAAADPR